MKILSLASIALAAAVAIAPSAHATSIIVGSTDITGNGISWTSTVLTFSSLAAVSNNGTGALIAINGDPVNVLTPITFSSPDGTLFTAANGVTFDVTGPISVLLNTSNVLIIEGTGLLTETGFAPTVASFDFSGSSNGSSGYTISIDSPAFAPAPEPTSLFLLGSGLLGLAMLIFQKSKSANGLI